MAEGARPGRSIEGRNWKRPNVFFLSSYFVSNCPTPSASTENFFSFIALHWKQVLIYVRVPKRPSQASLLNIKYLLNRIIIFCFELWYTVEKYGTRCSPKVWGQQNNRWLRGRPGRSVEGRNWKRPNVFLLLSYFVSNSPTLFASIENFFSFIALHWKQVLIYVRVPKRPSQASLLNIKYLPNRIIIFCSELQYSVE